MSELSVFFEEIQVSMATGIDIQDITDALSRVVAQSSVSDGSLNATVTGSTGSITTIEYEPGLILDLKRAITAMVPPGRACSQGQGLPHPDGSGHIQAALLGPSISLPVRKGRLKLGASQQVILINHDTKPRQRTVDITVIGLQSAL